jgi:hypothetical protein
VHNSSSYVIGVHARLDLDGSIGLGNARARHPLRHFGRRIADVDLAAGDIVFATFRVPSTW